MIERNFTPGTIVKHFKRELHPEGTRYLYRIIGTAEHTETGELLMIYQPRTAAAVPSPDPWRCL